MCVMFDRIARAMRACSRRIASCSLRSILLGTMVRDLMYILPYRRHQKGSAWQQPLLPSRR